MFKNKSMPVLDHLKNVFQAEFGNDFSKLPNRDNTLFVIIQHGFISIRPMMGAFLELGIHSDQVFMTTKPHTTPTYSDPIPPATRHPDDMLHYFKTIFKHYVPFEWKAATTTLAESDAKETEKKSRYKVLTDATHDKLFEKFCNYLIHYPDLPNRRIENIIICDEGGKFLSKFIERYHLPSSTARRNLNDYHVVAIEHTKCGTYRPELNNLPFPLINMADSYLKTQVESKFIAESMFVHLNAILQKLMSSSSMVIGVVGGGNIGKEVLIFLSEKYSSVPVIIFDRERDVLSSSAITALGWGNIRREETIEALYQQATVILGCTGKDFMAGLSTDCFSQNQASHIHLVSCSSGDTEFNTLLQQMPAYKFESLKDIRDYSMPIDATGEKRITLYNGGFPMNFLIQQPAGLPVEETVPLEQVQITRSMKLAAIVQAMKLLEVTSYFPKKYDKSLKDYMKLEVMYQWEIIQAFYHHLRTENPHTQLQIANGSMGIHQPTMNSVLNIPYYITTSHQVNMQSQLLKQSDVAIRRLVIHGTTGSGKTTLAQHYVQKYRMQHPEHLTRTIAAETALQWRDHLRAWAEELFPELKAQLLAETNPQRQENMIDQHLQAALCEKEWCIVLDNWDQDQLLFKRIEDLFLGSNVGHGILLITTQGESPYADPDQSLDLSLGLTQEESQKLLLKVMNLEKTNGLTWQQLGTEAELLSLIDYLNRLPLALVIAGSYLLWENKALPRNAPTHFTYANYKNLLELQVTELIRIHKEKLGKKGDIPREESEEFMRIKTQEAAVDLSLKKAIQPESNDPNMNLWHMLCFCGFLASDGIPQQLLKDYIEQILFEDEREAYETFFEMLLSEARKYSLLQFESIPSIVDSLQSLHMHRVVQKVLRDNYWPLLFRQEQIIVYHKPLPQVKPEFLSIEIIAGTMVSALQKYFHAAVWDQNFIIVKVYQPHVETWLRNKLNKSYYTILTLQDDLAYTYYLIGSYHQAEYLYRQLLMIRTEHYGAEADKYIVQTQNHLAMVLDKLGCELEAEILCRKALKTTVAQHQTEQHIDVAMIQQNLAVILRKRGEEAEAAVLYRKALKTTIIHYDTEKHVNVATAQQNLAVVLKALGHEEDAKVLLEKALKTKISHYKTDKHIDVAAVQQNFSSVLISLGHYKEAETHCQQSLETTIAHYGTEMHIDVATIQQNFANILMNKGQHNEAAAFYQKALNTTITHYKTKKHIKVALTQQGLVITLIYLGRYREAESLCREALETTIAHYQTEKRVEIATMQQTLATILEKLGHYNEAENLYRKALETTVSYYGTENRVEVLTMQQSLAMILADFGRYKEAISLYQKALETAIAYYKTEESTIVTTIQNNLAMALARCDYYIEAETLYRKVLKAAIGHYRTENHIEVSKIQQNLAITVSKLGKFSEAKLLYQSILKIMIAHYKTEECIDVAVVQQNLGITLRKLERYEEAEVLYRKALKVTIIHYKTENHIEVAKIQQNLAVVLENTNRYIEAKGFYQKAITVLINFFGEKHAHTLAVQNNFSGLLEKIRRSEENKPFSHTVYKCAEADKAIRRASGGGEHKNLVILLNQHPKLLNEIDKNPHKGWTALHWAINNNRLLCVVELLNRDARYDIPDKTIDTVTAIDIAIEKANTEICQALTKHIIKKHVKTNGHDAEKALRVAANSGDLSAVKLLIAQGVNIDAVGPESGKTALHQAVQKKHHSIVKFLIIAGANVNIEDTLRKKAVEYADQQLAPLFLTPLDTPTISR